MSDASDDPAVPTPEGSPPPGQPRWAWWVVGILVPLIGTGVAALQLARDPHPGGSPPGDTAPPSADLNPAAPAVPVPVPPAPPVSGIDVPLGYTASHGRWAIGPIACGEQQALDLDTGLSRTRPADEEPPPGSELVHARAPDCATSTLSPREGAAVGLLPAGEPQTYERCLLATGTPLGSIPTSTPEEIQERGIVAGAAICAVTGEEGVAMAVIAEVTPPQGPQEAVTLAGDLIVWQPEETGA
ncbi:hypothetical protein [Allostreptomyces psammosilenae]|uniref:Uncharacterized protein n=1 Tax=Allostreptomyces psammosilenae TaxID=1892865 RepID=A0A852ZWE5_9ACTN|nr:hypothetical protein [Allostreptomyces psammosilenae]NYI05997.1 hypothetical protein [Allostreptomyces psammosilenae]